MTHLTTAMRRALLLTLTSTLTACSLSSHDASDGAGGRAPSADNPGDSAPRKETAGARALALLTEDPAPVFADADTEFTVERVVDEASNSHVHLQRRHRGLRVIGGDVLVHLSETDGASSCSLRGVLTVAEKPSFFASDAIGWATDALGLERPELAHAELVVYARAGLSRLAYEVVLREDRAMPPSELHAFISASDGELIDHWDAVESLSSKGTGYYSGAIPLTSKKQGTGAVLYDAKRGGTETVDAMNGAGNSDKSVYSATGVFGTGALTSRASLSADVHYAMAATWDYFHLVHGRNGIDGAGHGLWARSHYGNNLANAFFDPLCGCISLGDGNPSFPGGAIGALASLDIVAHEVTHAVTRATAGLYGSGESGALNEATSDLFGTMVERQANNAKDVPDWLIGERVRPPLGLRSMAYPEKDGLSVGCWSVNAKKLDPHFSSGIANHFFYLLSEGTTPSTHTCGSKTGFVGIGAEQTATLWYRALTVYLTADASFSDARMATLQAAADLYGVKSLQSSRVSSAWNAVKVH